MFLLSATVEHSADRTIFSGTFTMIGDELEVKTGIEVGSGETIEVSSGSTRTNTAGIFYQREAQANGIKERKHFFSPLSSTLAEALNRDAETVEYTAEEEVSYAVLGFKSH